MPFFSIIIPTYNRAHTISRPVDSILAQTFPDWELIVIDDGSTDDTRTVVEGYKDERIRYVWQENQERSAARNHGIRLAKGEWICFQDSDDEYLPEHLEVHFNAINSRQDFRVFRSGLLLCKDGEMYKKEPLEVEGRYDSFPYDGIHVYSFHNSVLQGTVFHLEYYPVEDLHFLLSVGIKYKIHIINAWTGIYHYNINEGRINKRLIPKLQNRAACLDDILSWNKKLIVPYLIRKRCLVEILLLGISIRHTRLGLLRCFRYNFLVFLRFPIEYIRLVAKIVYVKIGEFSGFYRRVGRF